MAKVNGDGVRKKQKHVSLGGDGPLRRHYGLFGQLSGLEQWILHSNCRRESGDERTVGMINSREPSTLDVGIQHVDQ